MAFGIDDAIAGVAGVIKTAADKIWPDATEVEKAKVEQYTAMLTQQLEVFKGQCAIIVAEAQGGGMLQRNWRPITMLTFLGLVVGRFFGFEGPNFTPDDSANLFSLIQLGLGGYVVGRSVENVAKTVAPAIKAGLSR